MAKLYPVGRGNEAITKLWKYVKKGVELVGESYKKEGDDKITALFKDLTMFVQEILTKDAEGDRSEEKKDGDGVQSPFRKALEETAAKLEQLKKQAEPFKNLKDCIEAIDSKKNKDKDKGGNSPAEDLKPLLEAAKRKCAEFD